MKLYELIEEQMHSRESYCLGRALTIVDAAISDPEQRKGLKDLIKEAFNTTNWSMYHVGKIIYQFNEKYSKVEIPEDLKYFLANGEWKKTAHCLSSDQNYFPD